MIRTLPAYLGAWPKPGFLDVLPLGLGGRPDVEGFSQLLLGISRWQGRGFSVLSMDRTILEDVDRQIGFLEEDDLAQVRLKVGDLSAAKFRSWIDARSFTRAARSRKETREFLGILTQQLGVPQANALATAEALLDSQLKCPLRGEYALVGDEGRTVLDLVPASPRRSPRRKCPTVTRRRRWSGFAVSRPNSSARPSESSCVAMWTCGAKNGKRCSIYPCSIS